MENENKVEVAQEEQVKTEAPQTENVEGQEKAHDQRGPKNGRNDRKGGKRPFNKTNRKPEVKEFEERVVYINRVTKVVKGGKRMKFSALVVVGNHKGKYGFAMCKSGEVPDAIKKAVDKSKRNLYEIKLVGSAKTIAHDVIGKYGATTVFLKPALDGTGIIAGGPVRAILELCGVNNVYSKVYGSRTSVNVIRATNAALNQLKDYKSVQALRGTGVEEGGKDDVK
jgi:small subunit ribosomal protein S5